MGEAGEEGEGVEVGAVAVGLGVGGGVGAGAEGSKGLGCWLGESTCRWIDAELWSLATAISAWQTSRPRGKQIESDWRSRVRLRRKKHKEMCHPGEKWNRGALNRDLC